MPIASGDPSPKGRNREGGSEGRSGLRSPWAAPHSASVSNSISRCAAKPIISRNTLASEPFAKSARRASLSSVIVVVLGSGLCVSNPTLPKPAAVAAVDNSAFQNLDPE